MERSVLKDVRVEACGIGGEPQGTRAGTYIEIDNSVQNPSFAVTYSEATSY